jgi:hypothetical protein
MSQEWYQKCKKKSHKDWEVGIKMIENYSKYCPGVLNSQCNMQDKRTQSDINQGKLHNPIWEQNIEPYEEHYSKYCPGVLNSQCNMQDKRSQSDINQGKLYNPIWEQNIEPYKLRTEYDKIQQKIYDPADIRKKYVHDMKYPQTVEGYSGDAHDIGYRTYAFDDPFMPYSYDVTYDNSTLK